MINFLTKPPSPKVILFSLLGLITIFLLIISSHQPPVPQITKTNPPNQAKYILDNQPLTFNFNQPLTPKQISNLNFKITPPTKLESIWKNNQTLILTPTQPLQPSTPYQINFYYRDQLIYQYQFTTNPYSTKELLEQGKQQTLDDLAYGKKEASFYRQNPWYQKMPIKTQEYYIVYDFGQKLFRFHFYISPTPKLIQQALEKLKKIGVPEPIKYKVIPPKSSAILKP